MDWIFELVFVLLIIGAATVFHRLLGNTKETESSGTPATRLLNGFLVGTFVIMMGAAMVGAVKVFIATTLLFFVLAGIYVVNRISRRK
jgi:hypothetical protein